MWERNVPEGRLNPIQTPEGRGDWLDVVLKAGRNKTPAVKMIGTNVVIVSGGDFFNAPLEEVIQALRAYEIKEKLNQKNSRGWVSSTPTTY